MTNPSGSHVTTRTKAKLLQQDSTVKHLKQRSNNLLKETIPEIGMSIENARIECSSKTNHTCLHLLTRTMTR